MTAATAPTDTGWDRRRLLVILAAVLVAAGCLTAGLGYWAYQVICTVGDRDGSPIHPATRRGDDPPATAVGFAGRRDEIAAAPMLRVPAEAMDPAPPARQVAPRIRVPDWSVLGPASVPTGFPATSRGAVGQLAQIEVTVLQSMSLRTAEGVYQAWALPGGIGAQSWGLTSSVRAFLDRAELGVGLDGAATVTADPAGAMVKGTDGPSWVTACVLMRITAVYRSRGQVAFGYCERMQWVGGRWMIASGRTPAPAPSTWPDTAVSLQAGWRTWVGDVPSQVSSDVPGQDVDGPEWAAGMDGQEGE